MAGGGPLKIGSTNGFAVLESLKKKKKADKDSSKNKGSSKNNGKDIEPSVFWNPKPLVNKSWADVEDEDDDDYYATSAPPRGIWGSSSEVSNQKKEIEDVIEEESESEDGHDEGDEDAEEEPEPEPEVAIPAEPAEKKPSPVTASAPKDTERQLSKKELKKKGLEELDALLAELGISGKDNNAGQEQLNGKKSENLKGDGGKESAPPVPTESKTSKKKKSKKDKSSKEAKDPQEQQQPNGDHGDNNGDAPVVKEAEDVKERLKKVVSTKKKKTNKEMDAAAKAAAVEAAARSARLAAAKKKEKNHYNQQPVR